MDVEKCHQLHQGSVLPTEMREHQDRAWVREGLQFYDSLCDYAGGPERGEFRPDCDVDCKYLTAVWETCILPATGIVFCVVCLGAETNQFLDLADVRSRKVISTLLEILND